MKLSSCLAGLGSACFALAIGVPFFAHGDPLANHALVAGILSGSFGFGMSAVIAKSEAR